jgi:hypothetical protein
MPNKLRGLASRFDNEVENIRGIWSSIRSLEDRNATLLNVSSLDLGSLGALTTLPERLRKNNINQIHLLQQQIQNKL